jgi:hypothetical protein
MLTDKNFSRIKEGEKVKDSDGKIYRYRILDGQKVLLLKERFVYEPEEFLKISGSGLPYFDFLKLTGRPRC